MNRYSDVEIDFSLLKEKPINIRAILMKYLNHWRWFVISMAISLTLAIIYLMYAVPNYKVETAILFKDDMRGGVSELNVLKEMGLITQKSNVDNEVEVLKKSLIIEQVVRDMDLHIEYSEDKTFGFIKNTKLDNIIPKFLKSKEVVLFGDENPFFITISDNIVSDIVRPISFEVLISDDNHYTFNGKHNGVKFNVKANASDSIVNLPFGEIHLIKNTNFASGSNIDKINISINNPLKVAFSYQKSMKIELTSKTSSVANITLITMKGSLGRAFLKNYIEAYNQKGINDQIELADKTSKVIEEHLAQLSGELSSVETEAQDYKQSKGITNIVSQADIYSSQSVNVRQRQIDTESQLSIVTSIYNQVESISDFTQLIPASSGITSPSLIAQIESYNKLVLEHSRLSRIASSSNQSMIDLNRRLESTLFSLKSGLRNEKNNLEIQLRDITSMLSQNYARMRAIPQQEREYSDILRQQNVKETLFVYLLQKKEEKYMNMASVTPNSQLIDNIYVKGRATPNLILVGLIFIALGIAVPFATIVFKDILRYQIYTKEELEEISSLPVLGLLPKINNAESFVILENSKDTFSEMMRLIRANLLFVCGKKDKVINVLSSLSGEGKTFVSINLAQSIALLGNKVLIIGLDIRKPKLSKALGINNKNGITLYLSGQISKEELIIPSEVNPNLFIIPSGPIPPNPNELLAKDELDNLIKELRGQFDYIIIDTPPIGIVSDSFLLNRVTDVNLLVVRSGHTPKRYIEDIDTHYKDNKLKKVYFILNSVDMNKGYYGYGYGKKYSYGYGE